MPPLPTTTAARRLPYSAASTGTRPGECRKFPNRT